MAEEDSPPPSDPTPTASRRGVLRGALELGTITTAAIGVGAGVAHRSLSVPRPASAPTEPPAPMPTPPRSALAAALHEATLWHPLQTAGQLAALVESLAAILVASPGQAFYHTIEGRLASVPLPADASPTLAWHNRNRERLAGPLAASVVPEAADVSGYPLVSVPPGSVDGKPLLAVLDRRLAATHASVYFGGSARTLLEGITQVALASGAPPGIALGVAAMESRLGAVPASGRGIFGLSDEIAAQHRARLAAPSPHRSQPADPTRWSDPLTQTELFSAHFTALQADVQPALAALRERLAALSGHQDPLDGVDLSPLAALSALYGGAAAVEEAVATFAAQPDARLARSLGPAPHGLDAWLAVLAIAAGEARISTEAMLYPARVLAWSWLVSAWDETIAPNQRTRPPIVTEVRPDERDTQRLAAEGMALSAGAVLAGLLGLGAASGGLLTRRGVLTRWLPTAVAAGVIGTGPGRALRPALPAAQGSTPTTGAAAPASPPPPLDGGYEDAADLAAVLGEARPLMSGRMRQLRYRGTDAILPVEEVIRRRYLMDQQTALLADELEAWFGSDFVERFMAARRLRLSRARPLFAEGAALQAAALQERLERGQMIAIQPSSPELPYFCQQVGENSGLDNHPDALFMHRDFLTVLYALRALINHQIGLFNADPARLGYPGFPEIPWVSAVKISGAYRPMMQFYALNQRYPGRTTRRISAHTIGHALDIGSLAPPLPGAGVVRFAGDMQDRDGTIHIQAGELLPTAGFGSQTRQIISRMIGRALLVMKTPFRRQLGITLYPLWEARQLNWHVVIHAPERVSRPR